MDLKIYRNKPLKVTELTDNFLGLVVSQEVNPQASLMTSQ